MNLEQLIENAENLVAPGKGILAADESTSTIGKRFADIGVDNTQAQRLAYREALLSTPGMEEAISGVILYDETFHQSLEGSTIPALLNAMGVAPGIKVDTGTKPLAGHEGETITEGLDGLRERLEAYAKLGAVFAKWRGVIHIADTLPTRYCIEANAHVLARYAMLCQEQGMVPIIEPEVLMDGAHTIEECAQVTEDVLHAVFAALRAHGVLLEGCLLKPNMVVPGKACAEQASVEAVAEWTVMILRRSVPTSVPGIVFLSGGQTSKQATEHLHAMNALGRHPWELGFSFGRALQAEALQAWQGKNENVAACQRVFTESLKVNAAARYG